MPRAPTTLDPFNAVAELKRRQLLGTLADRGGELRVSDIVDSLGWPQPQVSKHLAVLRQVGLVCVRRQGRTRMYRLNGEQLKRIHEWTRKFERFWQHRLDRIKGRAEATVKGSRDSAYRAPHRRGS